MNITLFSVFWKSLLNIGISIYPNSAEKWPGPFPWEKKRLWTTKSAFLMVIGPFRLSISFWNSFGHLYTFLIIYFTQFYLNTSIKIIYNIF